jgi:two-component system phosphate regulon sensor histidine kinase PhoR
MELRGGLMFYGIRAKVTQACLLLACGTLLVLGAFLLWFLKGYFLENLESNLLSKTKMVRIALSGPVIKGEETIDALAKQIGRESLVRVTVIGKDGRVLGDSLEDYTKMENHLSRPEVWAALNGETGISTYYDNVLQEEMLYIALPVKGPDGIAGAVRLAASNNQVQKDLNYLWRILGMAILLTGLFSVILSFRLAESLTKPLKEVNLAAKYIAVGNLQHRVYLHRNDEIGSLGQTINEMAATISDKVNEISSSRQRLVTILYHLVSGVIVLDSATKVQMANPAAVRFFGLTDAAVLGKYLLEVVRHPELNERVQAIAKGGNDGMLEISLIYPEERVLQVYLAVIPGGANKIAGVLLVMHDITAIRRLEQVRKDFVANVSHELKTPITSIKGFAETLLDGALEDTETARRFLEIIDREALRLSNLVDELLDLAHLEARKEILERQPVQIPELIREVLAEFEPRVTDGRLSFRTEYPQQQIPMVSGNRARLKQVLVNLVDNAVKYTPAGGEIVFGAQVENQGLKVWVKDTGEGIPAADVGRVFERFYRVDKGRSRRSGGTGLGLAIVKHIIENHGGRVGVESRLGSGSTFYFILPLEIKQA